VAKKATKRAMNEAMGQIYDGLYQRLGTKERERKIYKMAKRIKKDERHHSS
jgi:hypothetical protein